MDKQDAITILKNIKDSLNKDNWKIETLRTINIYEKNIKILLDKKIRKLIDKQKEYINIYGEDSKKTIKINKKIDKELRKRFKN